MSQADTTRLAGYVKRFKRARDANDKQAKREKEALRFQVPEKQWSDQAKAEREGSLVGNVPIPPRPTLSVSQLAQPLRIIINQQRQADLGVNIHPLSVDADEDTAELKQGLYRAIERESIASDARDWGFARGVMAGRGYWRVGTRFDPAAPPGTPESFDQVITIERIYYQDMVFFDPAAVKADLSDAEYVFVANWVARDAFQRQWPKAQLPNEDKFTNPYKEAPDWVKGDGDSQAILVAEYWHKVHSSTTVSLVEAEDGSRSIVEGEAQGKVISSRTRDDVSIKRCVLTAVEILEDDDFPGSLLPIVPFFGEELQPFDDDRRFMGIIEPNMDAQRFYNFAASTAVERMAIEPKAPFQATPEQIKGWEDWYQQANRRNLPYLPYNYIADGTGAPLPPPTRLQIDTTGTSLAMMALQQAKDFLQSGTFIYDPSLGRPQKSSKSGVAIEREQGQADAANSNYLQNFARSLECEARIVLGLMPFVYDRKGRVVRTLSTEDETESVMLNQPFVTNPEDGEPIGLMENELPPRGAKVKHFDLSKGHYDVSVSIGRSYQTQLAQASAEIGDLLQADPSLMPLIGATYFNFRDFPGAREIAKIMKAVRDKQYPGLLEDASPPERLAAENEQLKARLEEAETAAQEMAKQLQMDAAKQQAALQKAQMDNETRAVIAAKSDAKDERIAQLEAKVDLMLKSMELEGKRFQAAHERGMQAEETKAKHETEILKPAKPLKEPLQRDREVRD